jgi:hypothetical protein
MNAENVLRLLRLFEGDDCSWLIWAEDRDELRFAVNCSDTFAWGTADAEDVSDDDLDAIAQAKTDSRIDPFWPTLWVARKRQMRPMRLFLDDTAEPMSGLLMACGPERDPRSEL